MPDWLSRHSRGAPFDRAAFLGSRIIYYPGHGLDGHPVKLFGASRAAHCFVYADYKIEWNDIQASLTLGRPSPHFRGYSLLDDIRLAESDLVPRGWRPTLSGTGTLLVRHDAVAPFGHLAILERAQVFDDSHGPSRLAFLFLGADGIATYDALFCQRDNAQPPYAVLLQDHAFGGNYDRFGAGGLMEHRDHGGDLPEVAARRGAHGAVGGVLGGARGGTERGRGACDAAEVVPARWASDLNANEDPTLGS